MPFPNRDTQFKPGQSGNPGGYSGARRIASAVMALIDEKGLDRDIALTFIAKALGRSDILGDRRPDVEWFRMLLDRIDGPTSAGGETTPTVDPSDGPKRIVIPDVDERLTPRTD